MFGTMMSSAPSLGVLLASTVGKVRPPSVERPMATFEQLTGAAVVLATSHVTAWVELPVQETAVLGVRT